MKQHFLKAIENTEYERYFSPDDTWMAKGSSAEGSLFPTPFGLTKELFKKEVLGGEPTESDINQLNTFIDKHKRDSARNSFITYTRDIDIMLTPEQLLSLEDILKSTNYAGYYEVKADICKVNKFETGKVIQSRMKTKGR